MEGTLYINLYRDLATSLRERDRSASDKGTLSLAHGALRIGKPPQEVLCEMLRGLEKPLTKWCPVRVEAMEDSKTVQHPPTRVGA